jgi:hypothetical protein
LDQDTIDTRREREGDGSARFDRKRIRTRMGDRYAASKYEILRRAVSTGRGRP